MKFKQSLSNTYPKEYSASEIGSIWRLKHVAKKPGTRPVSVYVLKDSLLTMRTVRARADPTLLWQLFETNYQVEPQRVLNKDGVVENISYFGTQPSKSD